MLPLDGLTVRRSARLLEALDQMNRAAKGVLLVVDGEGHFERTVTDGDLRRLLLAGHALDASLASLPTIDSVTLTASASTTEIAQVMDARKVDQVPIVDDARRPIGIWLRRELPTPILLSTPHLSEFEQDYVADAFRTNWIAPLGPNVDAFEQELATKVGSRHAAALSSGTAAIHLGLRVLGVGQGDVVFCSSFTFAASANPIVYQNAEPLFIDSEPESWNMSPVALRRAFREAERRGRLPRAVIVVSLYGQSANMPEIAAICDEYGVPILEDAAESLGATCHGRPSGTFGKIGVYSFNGNKIITTSGGGLLASADAALVARARHLSQQAREDEAWYEHRMLGYNYRMSNLVAAVGVGQLRHLNDIVAKRRQIFEWYRERLADLPQIRFMPEAAYGAASRWLTVVCFDGDWASDRSGRPGETSQRIRLALESENIEARPVWKPMHLQPVFRGARTFGGGVAERLFSCGLCLPSGTAMTGADCDEVCAVIRRELG
jgi:dTDP-4-amino-4,6-dideoxygalactose transaminase